MWDGWEVFKGFDPNNAADASLDPDNDGLINSDECLYNTNPYNNDTDRDGLTDGEEVNEWGTNPRSDDTDGDGINDGVEVANGWDPNDPNNGTSTSSTTTTQPTPFAGLVMIVFALGILAVLMYNRRRE